MSSTDADLSKRLSLLHSSIVHDALRMKGLPNQTLPYQIRPISSGKTISGKVWTLSGELQEKINEKVSTFPDNYSLSDGLLYLGHPQEELTTS